MATCNVILKDTAHSKGPCQRHALEPEGRCIFHMKAKNDWQWGVGLYPEFERELSVLFSAGLKSDRGGSGLTLDLRGTVFPPNFRVKGLGLGMGIPRSDFTGSVFIGPADFVEMEFHGFRLFSEAIFHKAATFERSTLVNVVHEEGSDFSWTTFLDHAVFDRAIFSLGTVNFSDAKFDNGLSCKNLPGYGSSNPFKLRRANFSRVTICGQASFDGAVFDELTDFRNAKFLRNEHFPQHGILPFVPLVNFDGCEFNGDVLFSQSVFENKITFSSAIFHRTSSFRNVHFEHAPILINTKFEEDTSFERAKFWQGDEETFRKIKRLMEEQKHHWEATLFHGRELAEQRIHSPKRFSTDYFLNLIYWITNDYGRSWCRPFLVLVICFFIFAGLFMLADGFDSPAGASLHGWQAKVPYWSDSQKALLYSFQSMRLGGLLGVELLVPRSQGWWWLSVVESIFSVVFLTMTVLSLRRRFKI